MARLSLSGNPPSDISGLTLWLKADAITGLNDGDLVSGWLDSSGNSNDFDAGSAPSQPTYKTNIVNSLPVVRFAGSQGRQLHAGQEANFDITRPSIFAVCSRTGGGTIIAKNTTSFSDGRRRKLQLALSGTQVTYSAGSDGQAIGVNATVSNFNVYSLITRTDNDHDLCVNGVKTNSFTALGDSTFNDTNVEIGQAFSNGAERLTGDIAEIIVFNRTLSNAERIAVEAYLAEKYAISITGVTRSSTASRTDASTRVVVRDFGNSLSFASGNYVVLKTAKILAGSTNATVSLWMNSTLTATLGNGYTLYAERGTSGNDIFKIEMDGQPGEVGRFKFTYRDDAGTLNQPTITTPLLNNGKWHHIALVKQGTGLTFYIDGANVGTATLTATDTFTNATLATRVGGDPGDGAANFTGKIDEVIVYNTNLSPSQISDIYFNNIVPTTNGLGFWKFNEGSGTAVVDFFGVQSDGTISSATYSTDVPMRGRTDA